MKRCLVLVLVIVTLCGCGSRSSELERVMSFRAKLLAATSCSFDATVTADYTDATYTFVMSCVGDGDGDLEFRVAEPSSISAITGTIVSEEVKLTFDDKALAFSLLADGQITPVSAPWLLLKCLRGGYVTSCNQEGDYLRITVEDGYEEDALRGDIWLDQHDCPVRGDFLWKDRRILSIEVKDFSIM